MASLELKLNLAMFLLDWSVHDFAVFVVLQNFATVLQIIKLSLVRGHWMERDGDVISIAVISQQTRNMGTGFNLLFGGLTVVT